MASAESYLAAPKFGHQLVTHRVIDGHGLSRLIPAFKLKVGMIKLLAGGHVAVVKKIKENNASYRITLEFNGTKYEQHVHMNRLVPVATKANRGFKYSLDK